LARSLLLDLFDPEEPRAALVEDGRLLEFSVEPEDRRRRVGDIVLGRVTRVEPAVQAAFVDIGEERPGFLHADDVMASDPLAAYDPAATAPRPAPGPRAGIASLVREGQSILVQVTRDSVPPKGPAVSAYVSLPGRFLVLMPSMERVGVSRRIPDGPGRDAVKAAVAALSPPEGLGIIVRTAGAGRTEAELRADLDALVARWGALLERARRERPPVTLRREEDLLHRVLRDRMADALDEVVVHGDEAFDAARAFAAEAAPPWADRIRRHGGTAPLFEERGVEAQVDRLSERRVPLPGGGFLLVEPVEGLTAIDVNSGKSTSAPDLEETAVRTDVAAAAEIGRQLRLRDIGGLVVVDFIDVRTDENRRRVDEAVAEALRDDPGRVRIAPMSEFGVVEITRRRTGPGPRQLLHDGCPSCRGRGIVLTAPAAGLRALRKARALAASGARAVTLRAHPAVAAWLEGSKGAALEALRGSLPRGLLLKSDPAAPAGHAEAESG
jgi:ribonuclease E